MPIMNRSLSPLRLQVGFEIEFNCPQPTPMLLMLQLHPSRDADVLNGNFLLTHPVIPVSSYLDLFGNYCSRIVAPAGSLVLRTDALLWDHGQPDASASWAQQVPVENLPTDTLVYLLGSRYCETDQLCPLAWQLFGNGPEGWGRVQAICDFVHGHLEFGYQHARRTRTAWESYSERRGVCRDFAHLAIALCRCMNIPARYCTGYLGDIRIQAVPAPMDFSGWFEAYLDGQWYTFDPRNNMPRIGRVLMARGRDACDVALTTAFGLNTLRRFEVWADEVGLS
jgi:transglutaminase-like putative cysteine protease